MYSDTSLTRFLDAQNQVYLKALAEIKNGQKVTDWMWCVFPQLKGNDGIEKTPFFGIRDLDEATAYLAHPVLGSHLLVVSQELLTLKNTTATELFGTIDATKLWSCMTLFSQVSSAPSVFQQVLDCYFQGLPDPSTLELLETNSNTV
jgi:uncharacterized protein (DUF1810 family)